MTDGKEQYTKFSKKDLIKMWRTLKAESGHRDTIAPWSMYYPKTDCSLRTLMDNMEKRTVKVKKYNKKDNILAGLWFVVMIILATIVIISKIMGSL